MLWDTVLSLRFLATFGIVLLPLAVLLAQVVRTWNPASKTLD